MPKKTQLTNKQIEQIREDYKAGDSINIIRKRYGLGMERVYDILDIEVQKKHIVENKRSNHMMNMQKYKNSYNRVLDFFNNINIGDRLELVHKDDMHGNKENNNYSCNVHCGEVIQKTDNLILVKENGWNRQSITVSQLLSKSVKVKKVG